MAGSSTALVVLHPREIPECMSAIQQVSSDICWISFMREHQATICINEAIRDSNYDRYVIVSDDCVVTQKAMDAVLGLHDERGGCVTGYCNLDSYLPWSNLCSNELPAPPPVIESYEFMTLDRVANSPEPVKTTFAGLALTCMERDLWLEHPLSVSSNGGQMDYMLSFFLQGAGVPIYAPPEGFVLHVKETWNEFDKAPEKQLLIGRPGYPPATQWSVS